ncbi:MAG: GHKL domain-containing protein [Syntrophomonas sp.]|nr:GHKL domain-containing protein [Syntrophomonas sp.]
MPNGGYTSAEEVISSSVTDFFNTVRSQRHDFSNHLQVIAALNHNNQKDELETYIVDLNFEVSAYNQVLKVDNPFVSALVIAKMARADAGRIRFEMDVNTPLADTTRNILAIVSILGNLLDNAIEAVEQQELENKWVRLLIHKKGPFLILEVSNPGTIEPEIAASLFQPGFTSKDRFHEGLGLYSASELARRLGGSIEYNFKTNRITFSLLIPK